MSYHHLSTVPDLKVAELRQAFAAEMGKAAPDRRLLEGYISEMHRLKASKYTERPEVAAVLDRGTVTPLRPVSPHLKLFAVS